ncbi:uncharacterized protein FSUBG_4016 [Fusarium subglutinans]|uniref:C2H2-type domain-containing protein n=1 Tax=Gibberella subglutinans TaxID=42677 RepID=A0A8H5V3G4_GIBSU|nr:uncharacterized protein FSUBG_4016 [Fusarium subglutinans]KAF5609542.1 hypothetical protein FSUBG_4016 [Fusarium subglutinans]
MSDWVNSTNPGGAAAGDAPPTKPSLNDLESAQSGVANVEEVSILGAESNVPEADVPSLLPSRMIQAIPTEAMSYSEASHSGPSYTTPTLSVPHASNPHLEELIQGLIDDPMPYPSLYWIPEFSWQDARLCFDGQPLELPATRDGQFSRGGPGSEHEISISQRSFPHIVVPNRGHDGFRMSEIIGVGGFVGANEHQGERNFDQNSIKPAESSSSSDTSDSEAAFRGDFIDASQPVQDEIAMQEALKSIVEWLVDDYYRSYAPQRRALEAKRKHVDRSSSSSTKKTRATLGRKGARSTGRRGQAIDGDEGSDDEESSGNGQNLSVTDTSSENSLLWACPFMKWNPRKYRGSCVKKLRDIYRLKKHLQEKHFSHHCYICFKEFRPEDLTQHEKVCENLFGRPTGPPPVGLITRGMATMINERSSTKLTSREQWERLFKIIFPNEPIPSSPYLDDERKLADCYEYFRQSYVQCQVDRMTQESGLCHLRETMSPRAFEKLAAELWGRPQIEHEISPHVASEEEIVDQTPLISTMEDYIPEESQTPPSRGFEYDEDGLNAIQPSVTIEVDNTATPVPELFGDQSETGVGDDLDRLQFIDTYGFSCSDVAGNMNFEEIESDPFSRPGAGDILWYDGQETFEADLGQMSDD